MRLARAISPGRTQKLLSYPSAEVFLTRFGTVSDCVSWPNIPSPASNELSAVAGSPKTCTPTESSITLSRTGAELLFQVFADRYERSSLLITSNLAFSDWG